jgi:hypothetical protein
MWFQLSKDGGRTFSSPIIAWPDQIGRNGAVSLVVDSTGQLHGFFAARIGAGFDGTRDLHGLWHTVWQGSSWSQAERVVSGPPSESFDPGDPRAVISQGNLIFVVYRTDPGKKIGNTWYTYEKLDVPELPVTPLPTPLVSLAGVANADVLASGTDGGQGDAMALDTLLPTPTAMSPVISPLATGEPLLQFSKDPEAISTPSPAAPLLGAIVPTALFVVAALLFGSMRRRKS